MNDIVLPEAGSRWLINGLVEVVVVRTAKRGRGYQVYVDRLDTGEVFKMRLKDFNKKAGAHVD